MSKNFTDLFNLEGKIGVVSGAVGHFGKFFVLTLIGCGAKVIMIDKNADMLADYEKEVAGVYSKEQIEARVVDQYDYLRAENVFKLILAESRVDFLVNNAFDFSKKTGFNDVSGRLENTSFEQFMACLGSGLGWPFWASKVFGLDMKKRGSGSIVNIGSMYSFVSPSPDLYDDSPQFNPPGYSAAKTGLLGLTRYLAAWLAPEIRVNLLAPGAFPKFTKADYQKNDPVFNRLVTKMPLGRLGNPDDLAGALIFLVSDASRYMTGREIVVDGGFTTI